MRHSQALDTTHSKWSFDYVLHTIRLLTFEALEMEHTCCFLRQTKGGWLKSFVIAKCDEEWIHSIRSHKQEKENSMLLESLMDEFSHRLKQMRPTPKNLINFIWGHWRRRMSHVVAPDAQIMGAMGKTLENIETCESLTDIFIYAHIIN